MGSVKWEEIRQYFNNRSVYYDCVKPEGWGEYVFRHEVGRHDLYIFFLTAWDKHGRRPYGQDAFRIGLYQKEGSTWKFLAGFPHIKRLGNWQKHADPKLRLYEILTQCLLDVKCTRCGGLLIIPRSYQGRLFWGCEFYNYQTSKDHQLVLIRDVEILKIARIAYRFPNSPHYIE